VTKTEGIIYNWYWKKEELCCCYLPCDWDLFTACNPLKENITNQVASLVLLFALQQIRVKYLLELGSYLEKARERRSVRCG
jgi:hypothetical protein